MDEEEVSELHSSELKLKPIANNYPEMHKEVLVITSTSSSKCWLVHPLGK